MVRDEIRDGKRIGELLASELTGLKRGPLEDIELVDVDGSAEPSPDGTRAYGLAAGDRFGTVYLFPECVELHLRREVSGTSSARGLVVETPDATSDSDTVTILRIERGAAVKRAADRIRAELDGETEDRQ